MSGGRPYRTADSRWRAVVTLNGRRRYVSGKTRAEVLTKVKVVRAQAEKGAWSATRPPTVEAWLASWLENVARPRVRPSTYASYAAWVRRALPYVGGLRIDRVEPEDLDRLYAGLADEGLSPGSVHHVHAVLRRAFTVGERRHGWPNPMRRVDSPSYRPPEMQALSPAEARDVLAEARADRLYARWAVALGLGLRQGEALGLCWPDVDLDVGALRVRQALQRQKGRGLVLVQPKSVAGQRTIALPPTLTQLLREHRKAQRVERVQAGPEWQAKPDLVFRQWNGRPLDPSRDTAAWHALLDRAGVRQVRLHDARHSAATLLLAQNVPLRVAMAILGHSQIGVTSRYQHVLDEMKSAAADAVDSALWPEERRREG